MYVVNISELQDAILKKIKEYANQGKSIDPFWLFNEVLSTVNVIDTNEIPEFVSMKKKNNELVGKLNEQDSAAMDTISALEEERKELLKMQEEKDKKIKQLSNMCDYLTVNLEKAVNLASVYNKRLDSVSTAQLVNYLKNRGGVETYSVDPYEGFNIWITGPAVVLVVDD